MWSSDRTVDTDHWSSVSFAGWRQRAMEIHGDDSFLNVNILKVSTEHGIEADQEIIGGEQG